MAGKGDVITAIAEQAGISKKEAAAAFDAFVGYISDSCQRGERCAIPGLGSFAVSQRTHEVGIRMALGARGGDVLGLVLREAMRPVVIGVVVGLAAAAGVSQILVTFLFGLSTLDPVTFVSVAALLMAVALLAGYVPARRATKVDPMVALRYQ